MKNNVFCISKKLIFIVGLFFLLLVVFLINTKIKNTKLGTSSKAFGKCSVVLKGGKKYISDPELCCGKSNGYSCGSPFIGSTYLINCQTGLMTKSTSLKACQEQINKIGIKAGKSRNFPNKTENITPTPTKKPLKLSPTVTNKPTDYVATVSLNKIDDVNYDLSINQRNFGSDANSTTKIIIIPLTAGDASSSYSVNNECMTNGGRIEKLTLAKAEIIITTNKNNFNIVVTGKNLDGVENFNFLNMDISYNVPGKSIGAVITKTILDRGDGNKISIKGCFNKI